VNFAQLNITHVSPLVRIGSGLSRLAYGSLRQYPRNWPVAIVVVPDARSFTVDYPVFSEIRAELVGREALYFQSRGEALHHTKL
jgi:hypothetical protein